jgi:hypothetical protein
MNRCTTTRVIEAKSRTRWQREFEGRAVVALRDHTRDDGFEIEVLLITLLDDAGAGGLLGVSFASGLLIAGNSEPCFGSSARAAVVASKRPTVTTEAETGDMPIFPPV